ncbi:hypothetical protein RFI_40132, partial [Reticulomyxa filosa]
GTFNNDYFCSVLHCFIFCFFLVYPCFCDLLLQSTLFKSYICFFVHLFVECFTNTNEKKKMSKMAKEATTWHKIPGLDFYGNDTASKDCVNIIDAIAEGKKSNGGGFTVDAKTVWKKSTMSNAKSN